jgi:hypothetical protein
MARRGHGEGSVYQRKDKRWVASITLVGRKRKYFYGETKKEVLEQLKTALHQQQQGTLVTGPQQKVEQFLTHWLETVQRPTMRVRSFTRYQDLLRLHILPVIGYHQLQKLSPQHVQGLYAQKLKEGLSASTVHSIHAVLLDLLPMPEGQGIPIPHGCGFLLPRDMPSLVPFRFGLTVSPQADTASPAARMLYAALISRSWQVPHSGHTHSRMSSESESRTC